MTNKTKKIAVIPLKKDSQRLNNKNFLKLGNMPLWEWTLNCLNDSAQLDHIIISTDSEEILSKKKDFKPLINARLETIDEKISFKKLIKLHRCVAVADGFYEWK